MRNTRLCAILLAVVLFVSASVFPVKSQSKASGKAETHAQKKAQPPTASDPNPDSKRPPELVSLIIDAHSTFPEFSADMLMTIAESEKVADKEWKKELLEEAFRVASWAQYPVPQKAVGPYPMDTKYGYLGEAFKLKMDALSLQCRVVNSMAGLDKAKARELFSEIDRPKFTPVNCSDGLVYEVSAYYETAAKLAQQAFSIEEMRQEEHIRFLESLMLDISSPVQIAPMAKVIHSMKLSRSQREALVAGFASVLRKMKGDDRSFSSSLYTAPWEIGKLDYVCRQEGISTSELNGALREYYVRHFSAERCSDILRTAGDKGPLPSAVRKFNERLLASGEKKVLKIEADEIKPSKILGAVDLRIYWQKPPSSEIMRSFKSLRFRPGRTTVTRAEAETHEWRSALDEHLKQLSSWKKGKEESNEEHFHQKCLQYEAVLLSLPHWPQRDEVVMEFLDFLDSFDLKHGSRIEWFWHADSLTRRLDLLPKGKVEVSEAKAKLIRQLQSSKNPVLYLYSQMRKILSGGAKMEAAQK